MWPAILIGNLIFAWLNLAIVNDSPINVGIGILNVIGAIVSTYCTWEEYR